MVANALLGIRYDSHQRLFTFKDMSFMDCKGVEGWGGWDLLSKEGLESDSGPCTITKFVFL